MRKRREKSVCNMPLCFVYYNLHKHCWSVKDVATQKVVAHLHSLVMYNSIPKVSEAGRQRVLRERKKNVHAGFEGYIDLRDPEWMWEHVHGRPVTYNPYKNTGFVWKDEGELLNTEEYYIVRFGSSRDVYAAERASL